MGRASWAESQINHPVGIIKGPIGIMTRTADSVTGPLEAGTGPPSWQNAFPVRSVQEALAKLEETSETWAPGEEKPRVWILGGTEVYREGLAIADVLSLTVITDGFDAAAEVAAAEVAAAEVAAAEGENNKGARPAYFPEGFEEHFVLNPDLDAPKSEFDA